MAFSVTDPFISCILLRTDRKLNDYRRSHWDTKSSFLHRSEKVTDKRQIMKEVFTLIG